MLQLAKKNSGVEPQFFLNEPRNHLNLIYLGEKTEILILSLYILHCHFLWIFFKQTDVTSSDFYKNYALWCPTVKRQDVPCFNIDFQLHSYVSGKQLLFKIYNSYKHWSSTNSSFPVVWAQKLRHHLTFLPKSECPQYTSHSTETHPFTNSHVKFSMFISN